jgi:GH24 family phage-related lysozyme (muramidase)
MAKTLLPVKFLSQRDNDSEVLYGKHIGPSNECAPTSMAIVASAFGYKGEGTRQQQEDEISNRLWVKYGMRASGTLATMKTYMIKEYGLEHVYYFEGRTNVAEIKKALDAGKLVIAHTALTGSGHVIVICGYDDSAYGGKGAFICCDPWGEWNSWGYSHGLNNKTGKQYGDHVLYSYRLAASKFYWHHQIVKPGAPLRKVNANSGAIEQVVTGEIIEEKPTGKTLKQGKLRDFFHYYDPTNEWQGEAANALETAMALKAKGFCSFASDWVLAFRGQTKDEAEPGYIKHGKLRDFFHYYNDDLPNHRKAVDLLEAKLRKDAPELLNDAAHWVVTYRKQKAVTGNNGLSAYGFKFLEHFEGCHKKIGEDQYTSYPDAGYGWSVATIGIGSTRHEDGSKVRKGEVINRRRAVELVRHEIAKQILPTMKRLPTWNRMNADQKEALIIFSFNLGPYWYHGSGFTSITRLADNPDRWTDEAFVRGCFMPYVLSNGKTLQGLVRRRRAEAALFLGQKTI